MEEKFIEALKKLEFENSSEEIVALFSDESEIGNVAATELFQGQTGAREFWKNYRDTFDKIESSFKNKIVSGSTAALEWTSVGTSKNGSQINYEGVSILKFDGDKIRRFFAYFNPAKLGREMEMKQNG